MKKRIFSVLLACSMLLSACGHPQAMASSTMRENNNTFTIILEEKIPLGDNISTSICGGAFNLINEYRQENNLKPLAWSIELEDCAAIRATEASQAWSHTRPNGKPWYTVNENIMYGENLAKNYDTSSDLVAAWQASPAHNENLLYADFRYVAIVEYNGYFACEFS